MCIGPGGGEGPVVRIGAGAFVREWIFRECGSSGSVDLQEQAPPLEANSATLCCGQLSHSLPCVPHAGDPALHNLAPQRRPQYLPPWTWHPRPCRPLGSHYRGLCFSGEESILSLGVLITTIIWLSVAYCCPPSSSSGCWPPGSVPRAGRPW